MSSFVPGRPAAAARLGRLRPTLPADASGAVCYRFAAADDDDTHAVQVEAVRDDGARVLFATQGKRPSVKGSRFESGARVFVARAGGPDVALCESVIGGLVVQLFFANFTTRNPLDHRLMQRLSGTAMDFLVVAAISTINVEVVLGGLVPLAILVVAGVLWNVFCVMWLARRLLPADSWFERSIAEMGQSMGVTATGLLLLRVVDPEGPPTPPPPSATNSSCTSRSWAAGYGPALLSRWRWPTIRCGCSASAPERWRSGCWCGRCSFADGSASVNRVPPALRSILGPQFPFNHLPDDANEAVRL